MNNVGWISIHRKLLESDLWLSEKFTKGQAWIDLILLANHEIHTLNVRGNDVVIERGQVGWSEDSLALRWSWSRMKVRRYKLWLKRYNRITYTTNTILGVITISNYNQYQQTIQQTIQQKDNRRDTNNKDNKDNKVIPNGITVKDQYGNKYINFILDEFKRNVGISPIDTNARNIAHNIHQITNTFNKKYGELYKQKRGVEIKLSDIIKKAWEVYKKKNGDHLPQRIKTFKEHYKGMLEQLSISLQKE